MGGRRPGGLSLTLLPCSHSECGGCSRGHQDYGSGSRESQLHQLCAAGSAGPWGSGHGRHSPGHPGGPAAGGCVSASWASVPLSRGSAVATGSSSYLPAVTLPVPLPPGPVLSLAGNPLPTSRIPTETAGPEWVMYHLSAALSLFREVEFWGHAALPQPPRGLSDRHFPWVATWPLTGRANLVLRLPVKGLPTLTLSQCEKQANKPHGSKSPGFC